jgi:hypothetical protein
LRVAITFPPFRISTVAGPSGQFPVKVACNLTLIPTVFLCIEPTNIAALASGLRGRAVSRCRPDTLHLSRQVGLFSYRRSLLGAFSLRFGDDVLHPGECFLLERLALASGPAIL